MGGMGGGVGGGLPGNPGGKHPGKHFFLLLDLCLFFFYSELAFGGKRVSLIFNSKNFHSLRMLNVTKILGFRINFKIKIISWAGLFSLFPLSFFT